jgi:hypothetical protein
MEPQPNIQIQITLVFVRIHTTFCTSAAIASHGMYYSRPRSL